MTMTSTDPFQVAKDAARTKREQAQAQQAELAEQAERQRRQRVEQRRIAEYREYVERCIHAFYEGVVNYALEHDWSESGIEAAQAYCVGLVNQQADAPELPNISSSMKEILHEIFVRKILFYGDKLPERPFYGQKLDWYPDMLERAQKPRKMRSFKAKQPRVVIPTTTEPPTPKDMPQHKDASNNDNVVELKSATTPKKRKKQTSAAS